MRVWFPTDLPRLTAYPGVARGVGVVDGTATYRTPYAGDPADAEPALFVHGFGGRR